MNSLVSCLRLGVVKGPCGCLALAFMLTPLVSSAQVANGGVLQQGASHATQADRSQGEGQVSPVNVDIAKVRLLPGSRIGVHVFEEPDLDGPFRLDPNGDITVPLAGVIHLQGSTVSEAEVAISRALVSGQILKAAHVVVSLAEYGTEYVTILGEVNSPGRFPLASPMPLLGAIGLAGGQTAIAGNEIVIHRASQPTDVNEELHYSRSALDSKALGVNVNPGDTVVVKRAGVVYVLGAVTRPGGYIMQDEGELNVEQALALSQGTTLTAKTSALRVLRKLPDGTIQDWPVNYTKLNRGQEDPLKLVANDILYVPQSGFKNVLVHATSIFSSAASATVYKVY